MQNTQQRGNRSAEVLEERGRTVVKGAKRPPVEVRHRPDEVGPAVHAFDGADRLAIGKRDRPRTRREPGRHVRHRRLLRLEHDTLFSGIRDLEHALFARLGRQQEVLITLARESLGDRVQSVQIARNAGGVVGVESGGIVHHGRRI